jgi:hypothetical protein
MGLRQVVEEAWKQLNSPARFASEMGFVKVLRRRAKARDPIERGTLWLRHKLQVPDNRKFYNPGMVLGIYEDRVPGQFDFLSFRQEYRPEDPAEPFDNQGKAIIDMLMEIEQGSQVDWCVTRAKRHIHLAYESSPEFEEWMSKAE